MLSGRLKGVFACLALCWGFAAAPIRADDAPLSPDAEHFFESKIRPLLANRCFECHGPDKGNGSLRVDSLQGMLDGGDSGPALVPGAPAESLIIEAVKYESYEMPPTGKLSDDEISLLTKWVELGAPWPGEKATARTQGGREFEITGEDRAFWSFQPPKRSPVPVTTDPAWPENPVDSFLSSAQASAGLNHSPRADRSTLLRRLFIDLAGLPPTAADRESFLSDGRPDAYARLTDRLLASPRYGERWGRHWMDVVRFAQTNGYERDAEKPFAWRYRDWIINSFNSDKPYDRFVAEQIAGDELEPVTDDALMATGFARLGVWDDEPDDAKNAEFEALDDLVSTTGTAFLGLTVGCARCHDHKFDPIPQRDYYGLVAFFRGVREYEKHEGNKKDFSMLVPLSSGELTLGIRESSTEPPATHILIRGDAHSPASEVEPRFVDVLCSTDSVVVPSIEPRPEGASTSGRRRLLAEWLTRPDHPLTARVMVNRLWHHHFGRGLVPTPSDFGQTGTRPVLPELLDWLAIEFVDQDWSLKAMHRLMIESAAYQQTSSTEQTGAVDVDPDNQWVWRQSLRRLDAESMRDAVLATSGRLNDEMSGRGFFPTLSEEVLSTQSIPGNGWGKSSPAQEARRSVYMFVKRTLRPPLMETFDAASPDQSIAGRSVTTIAPQALLWLNSQFMEEESLAFAGRVIRETSGDAAAQIQRAYDLALGRSATAEEVARLLDHYGRQYQGWSAVGPPEDRSATDPLEAWRKFGGEWTVHPEDASLEVLPDAGGKLVAKTGTISDGTIDAEVIRHSDEGDIGIIFRLYKPAVGVNSLIGYNLNLTKDRIRLGRHDGDYRELASAPLETPVGVWRRLHIKLLGPNIRVIVDGSPEPILDFTDPKALTSGQVGIRTFQAHASVRGLLVESDHQRWKVGEMPAGEDAPVDEDFAHRRALASVCRVILNLNEFVYVD